MVGKFKKEVALLKNLQHENIVTFLDYSFKHEQEVHLYMEYLPGGSIQSMLETYGPFDEEVIRNFTRQLLKGLSYLHSKHVIHADLKGANILFDGKGNIKLSDFGAARNIENLPIMTASSPTSAVQ
eukprot:CAMPEP_0202970246 /NCGR_PEP_ID=MMETSP1396-20130829/16234_1 /ASSEMBLY_ACC=CAM_ASM_000872 /TAXON_ID= /ORGANISM="Pseudokeronopsis sp., Strain Brazil" /LENGTH=125 /DNA_ID=CAMNT_0049698637 /DNA_START=810 /DNA_END=1188 /DNA_ORIENTATION=+